ncbi:MAG: type II secretion system protein [Thiobacillus sp.]|nr:type II secretion system protein [Thiobacillus sp.]
MARNTATGNREGVDDMVFWKPNQAAVSYWTRSAHGRQDERGFTYIGVLVLVALMGIALAAVGQMWHTLQQREKEQELLFIGHQFRLALNRYDKLTPGQATRYPVALEDLLQDPRRPEIQRYLRQIYRDPMTGNAEWGLITGPDGEIYGVHSLSENEPVKKSNFGLADRQFEGRMKYSDWVFMHAPG